MSYTIKKHITDIDFNNEEITVEYNFSKAELGHFDGTGLQIGVDWDSSMALNKSLKTNEQYKTK